MPKDTITIEFTRKQALQFVTEMYATYAALKASCATAVREDLSHTERVADLLAKWLADE